MDALEGVGALNNTMFVLTSLTGALLGEFGMLTSSDVLKNAMLHVPLAVRMPGECADGRWCICCFCVWICCQLENGPPQHMAISFSLFESVVAVPAALGKQI